MYNHSNFLSLSHVFVLIAVLMDGTVSLKDDGDFVASQMWEAVSSAMAYSSTMMDKLFDTVGAPKDERSPFCRKFSSLTDLRDELIQYLPRTFKYGAASGGSNNDGSDNDAVLSDEASDGMESDGGAVAPGSKEAMLDRIRRFASEMAEDTEKEDAPDEDDEEEEVPSSTSTSNTSASGSSVDNSQEMMTHFRALVGVDSIDNIFEKVLAASACLERKDNIRVAASQVRQAKSLVQRWLTKPLDTTAVVPEDGSLFAAGDMLIERDVVVLVNIKVGKGASASTVLLPFRVVDIYDKYYNKWFMSKSKHPIKNWKKETKMFKLKIRMLDKDIVNEYCDVGLCGNSTYSKENICGIIESSQIVSVVGKLQSIA